MSAPDVRAHLPPRPLMGTVTDPLESATKRPWAPEEFRRPAAPPRSQGVGRVAHRYTITPLPLRSHLGYRGRAQSGIPYCRDIFLPTAVLPNASQVGFTSPVGASSSGQLAQQQAGPGYLLALPWVTSPRLLSPTTTAGADATPVPSSIK
ncbi:uncharacterized protein LOC125239322 [Leguminivora glycinivorella]|uniref:uncharacterized protein LOC125239322 n=1 Tax=Leguminivora glycinivorella TaxID=1035111 RepID=UPI00200F5610|nr:uncharacterized protein LOC125239322 [Leguminivora glycinivorella]